MHFIKVYTVVVFLTLKTLKCMYTRTPWVRDKNSKESSRKCKARVKKGNRRMHERIILELQSLKKQNKTFPKAGEQTMYISTTKQCVIIHYCVKNKPHQLILCIRGLDADAMIRVMLLWLVYFSRIFATMSWSDDLMFILFYRSKRFKRRKFNFTLHYYKVLDYNFISRF